MNGPEPVFLTLDQVMRLHDRALHEHGGSAGVRDLGLIESAVAAARNTYYYAAGDLFDIAATYAFHLAQAQAFLDGNKRNGVAAALVFLEMNVKCRRPDPLLFHACMESVATRTMTKKELAAHFRKLAVHP